MVLFVKRMLGDDVLSVELTKKQIWACFEQATLTYSSIVNFHQAKNQLADFLGQATGSMTGSESKYPRETLDFLVRQAEPYAILAGLGGSYDSVLGSIALTHGQQDYNLYTDLKNASGSVIFDSQPSGSQTKLRIMEVYHFNPAAAYRFFDSTSAINYLNNEFSFESFTPETIFYVLPVFEDILRAGQMSISQKVRRSNYSYEIIGRNIRIHPMPTGDNPRNLYIRVQIRPDPLDPSYNDDSIYGISNITNVPFGNIPFSTINSAARQWIRLFCLALCKEVLGLIRRKFKTVPIPGSDLSLDGEELVSQGREDQEKLRTQLMEMLDAVTYDALLEREASKAENLNRTLILVPMKKPITMG